MNKEDKAGLYITVIFHLAVIIVFLLVGLGNELKKSDKIVMDFSAYEALEEMEKELAFKEEVSKRLEEMIRNAEPSHSDEIRNYAVDGGTLKDDRGTDAEQLYEDARRLAEELAAGEKSAIEENAVDEVVEMPHKKKNTEAREYTGPSVLRYNLDGRKASHLKIPAYKCYGAGEVTVIIKVNNAGNVVYAKVDDNVSSSDPCLRNYAIRAARLSKFSASPDAPANQAGDIVYRFIAQ